MEGALFLLYESKYLQHLENLRMNWIGPYTINSVIDGGDVQLQDLASKEVQGLVNRCRLKLYRDNQTTNPQ